jgi:S-adenosylmethionine:tRNA-ribosyltransferase-isomerase (queuine synthetase)
MKYEVNESGEIIRQSEKKKYTFLWIIVLVATILISFYFYNKSNSRRIDPQELIINTNNSSPTNLDNKKITLKTNRGIINGTNVIMRNWHSTQSKIIGSFKNSGERVVVLESHFPNNNGETLIFRGINVRTNIGTSFYLQKGKSVIILAQQNGLVRIQFKDKELRSLTTSIKESYLDRSVNSKWYKVRRNNGEIGWVFGKFIDL